MRIALSPRRGLAALFALTALTVASCIPPPDSPAAEDTPAPAPSPLAAHSAGPATRASGQLPAVLIGDVSFAAELAHTPSERVVGLSGRDSLPANTGMLFIFDSGVASSFWMKGMRFPLDFIWVSSDCTVADVTENVPAPAPGTPQSELRSYRSSSPAAYAFEINGGEAGLRGIEIGDRVRFEGLPPSLQSTCS